MVLIRMDSTPMELMLITKQVGLEIFNLTNIMTIKFGTSSQIVGKFNLLQMVMNLVTTSELNLGHTLGT